MLDTQQQQHDAFTQQLSGRRLRGLSWNKTHEAWRVRIYFHGKLRFVGRFEDSVVAAKHYDKAAMYLYGDNAITNFGLEACKADASTPVGACIIQAKQEAEEAAAKQQAGHLQQEQHQRAMMHHHHHHLKQGRNMLLHVQGDSKVSQQLHLNIARPSDGLSPLVQQRLPHAAAFTITEQQQQQGLFSFDQQQQQQQQQSFSFDPQLHQLQSQLDLQGLQVHEQQQQLLLQLQQQPLLWQGNTAIAPGYGADVGATSAPVTPVASAVVAAAAAAGNNLGFCSKQQYVLAHHHQQLTEQQQGALPLVNGDAFQGFPAAAMSCCLPDVQPQQLLPTVFPALAGQAAHLTPPAGGSVQQGLSVSKQQLTQLRQQQLQLQQQQRDAEELLRQLKSLALQDTTSSNSSTSSHMQSPSLQILQMVAADNPHLTISGPQQQRLPPQQLSFMQIPGNSRLCPGMAIPEDPGVAGMAAAAAAVGHSTSATVSGCLSPVTPPLLGAASHWLTMNRLLQGSGDYAESVASMASSGVLEHLAAAGL